MQYFTAYLQCIGMNKIICRLDPNEALKRNQNHLDRKNTSCNIKMHSLQYVSVNGQLQSKLNL